MQEVPMPAGGVPPGGRGSAHEQISRMADKKKRGKKDESKGWTKKSYLYAGFLIIILVVLALLLL